MNKLEQLLMLLDMFVGDGTCVRSIDKRKNSLKQQENNEEFKSQLPTTTNDEIDEDEGA